MNHTESYSFRANTIPWIEKLLQTPIDDYRKNAVNLILAPYLIKVRKVSYDAALNIINSWLGKCGDLRRLDNNLKYIVKYAIKSSLKKKQLPLRFENLKLRNKILCDLVRQ